MEQETSVSTSLGSINLDAKPKKSILKRSEPESSEPADGGDGEEGAAGAARHHVPFSHIIPELSRLDGLGGASADRVNSDLQSVSSAASLSPLSSDEQLDGGEPVAQGGSSPRHVGHGRPGGSRNNHGQQRRRRNNNRRGRGGPRGLPVMPEREAISPLPLPPGTESPHHLAVEKRSPSPVRLVRYSPSPERQLHVRHSRSRSRSPVRRSPVRRSPVRRRTRSRRSRSRSPRRRSRSPGRYRRGRSPRYGHSPPGRRRGWSRSPSPRRRRSRSRSRSPPWGRNVERSLLAMSRSKGAPSAGYGPPAGMPGYPPMQYAAPHPPHPYMQQPMPYPMPMVPGMNPAFGQPMYAPPGAPMYLQPQLQPQPPAVSMSVPAAGVSERIDSGTVLREVERRRQQKTSQQPQRQLTDVLQRKQAAPAAETPAETPAAEAPKPPQKLPSEEVVSKELIEIQKKKPWFTQELMNLKLEMDDCKKEHKNKKYFRLLAKQWNRLVLEAKQKMGLIEIAGVAKQALEGGQGLALSSAAIAGLTTQHREHVDRRDRLAGELHQLKLEQKALDSSNIVMKKGQPTSNHELHDNLKRQGELLKALEWEVAVVGQLKKVFDPSGTDAMEAGLNAGLNGIGNALVKAAKEEADGGGSATSKSEVDYLLLGDETLSAVQVYIREQESRASFGTTLPTERIRLVSRPDAALSSVEFRHWVRAAVRQSATETLVLLASAGCLEAETGTWSAAAAVTPLLPLLRDLRADGLTRVVVVGLPVKPGAATGDRATQFNRALQEQLETAGPHVPRVTYTPIKGGPQDGFGEQTEGGLTLDLYRTLLQILSKCEQKQQSIPGVSESGESELNQLETVEDAADTLQGLLDGLRGRLAGDEAAGLGAVAALLDKLKSQGDGTEQLLLQKQEEQNLAAEDPAVFFRDPADHVCLHCEMIFLNAKAYLEHLKSADHMKKCQASQNAPEAPWRKGHSPY